MESHWVYELYLEAGPMPKSSWPTQNQPNGSFENFLSYFALLGHFVLFYWFCLFLFFYVYFFYCLFFVCFMN